MALVECKECGDYVSSSAKRCPHCGIDSPGHSISGVLSGLVVFLFIASIIVYFSWKNDPVKSDVSIIKKDVPTAASPVVKVPASDDMVRGPDSNTQRFLIAPVEAEAVMSRGTRENATALNTLVRLVRGNNYRCDSISSAQPHLLERGYTLVCNQFNYEYEIVDKGGNWIVTVD